MFVYTRELSVEVAALPLNAIAVEMLPAELAEQAARAELVILMGKNGSRYLKHFGRTRHATTAYTMFVPAEGPIIPGGWQFVEFATERGSERRANHLLTDAVYFWVRSGVDEAKLTCLINNGSHGFAYSLWDNESSAWEPWRHTWSDELVDGDAQFDTDRAALEEAAAVIPF